MDSASAICACRARRGHGICHYCAPESWPERIDRCGPNLDDKHWDDRERPLDRNRSALCLALWSGNYFLAQLLGSKEVALAHLDPGIDFPWHRAAGKGADAPRVFLRDRARRALACERLAASLSSRALCRAYSHAGHPRSVGHSFSATYDDGCGARLVVSSI